MAHNNPILDKATKQATVKPVGTKLSAVEEALAASGARADKFVAASEKNLKAAEDATGAITAAIADISAANQISARANLNANLKQQSANIDIFEAAGGFENQIKMMATIREDSEDIEALLNRRKLITSGKGTTEEGETLSFIGRLVRVNAIDKQLKSKQRELSASRTQISDITGAQEAFASANTHTKKTLNEGVIEANMKHIAADGRQEAAKQELTNIHSNAAALTNLAAADQRSVSNLMAAFRLEGEAEQRVIAKEAQTFRRESMKNSREVWLSERDQRAVNLESSTLRLNTAKTTNPTDLKAAIANNQAAVKRHNDNLVLEEQIIDGVQRAQSMAGIPVEEHQLIVRKFKDPRTAEKYIRLQEIGGVENPVFGPTPADSQSTMQLIDEAGTGTQTKGTKLLKQITAEFTEDLQRLGANAPKDEEAMKSLYNKKADDFMDKQAAEIKAGDQSNPYIAPPMAVLADKRSVNSTALYQKVLKAMGMVETDPQRIMDAGLAAMVAKVITADELSSGIEAIFEAAAAHNNTNEGGFTRVGLPTQKTYNVKLDRVPTLFETLKVLPGLANPFTLSGKAIVSGAATAGEFIQSQVGAFVTVDLMSEVDIQQAIAIIMSTARPIPVPTAAEKEAAEQAEFRKSTIGDNL